MKTEQLFKVSRIEAISDGVFAIAMTLLVLELKLPELEQPTSPELFRDALAGQLPHTISWIISFAILCRLWITQHALLRDGDEESRVFTLLNFAFLGGISFIPFPTSLIGEHAGQPLSVIIFSAVIAFSGLMLALMYFVKKPALGWRNLNPAARDILIGLPIIGLIACGLALWSPKAGIAIWCITPFIGFSLKKKSRKKA